MFVLALIVLVCSPVLLCEASFVDNLVKCSIKDNTCMKEMFQKIYNDISKDGLSELEIPKIDPYQITNISIAVLDTFTITITEGEISGLKNCVIDVFMIDIDKLSATQEMSCDTLTIKGKFIVGGSSPALQNLLGSASIDGQGKTKVKLDHLVLKFYCPFSFIKKDDGDIYVELPQKKIKYDYNIKKATFSIKNLLIGQNDISQLMMTYLNDNWKVSIDSYGKKFFNKAVEICYLITNTVYEKVAMKHFIIEDLSSYIKN